MSHQFFERYMPSLKSLSKPPCLGKARRSEFLTFSAALETPCLAAAMLAGFDVHVAKPVEPSELVAVVSRLVHVWPDLKHPLGITTGRDRWTVRTNAGH